MPKKKHIEQKKQRFVDVTFSTMSICAKKATKLSLLGEEKKFKTLT